MSKMMRFLNRTNASLPFGNRNPSRENVDPRPVVPTRPSSSPRTIPTPLQLNGQTDSANSNSNNGRSSRGNRAPETRSQLPTMSRRMSDTASQFPFYHGYLSEDQEEDVFKDHLYMTGSYIMRDSKSNSRAITMSVVIDPLHLYHFQVVQRDRKYHVVGKGKEFPTLNAMIEYYQSNNIPGKTDEPVFLTVPIINTQNGRFAPSPSPPDRRTENGRSTPNVKTFRSPQPGGQTYPRSPASPHRDLGAGSGSTVQRPFPLPPIEEPIGGRTPVPFYENAEAEIEERLRADSPSNATDLPDSSTSELGAAACVGGGDITSRPMLPIPRPSSDGHRGHIYSEPDHPDLDRIKMVMELCRQSDVIHASRKKCTCGLYLEESTLTQGWMMHIDNEPGKTQGRLFFLDTKTNTTAWSLPDDIITELKTKFPVKWEFVEKQVVKAKRKNSGT